MTRNFPARFWSANGRKPAQDTLLFIVHFDPDGLNTIQDNIAAWIAASGLTYEVLNMWDYGPAPLILPRNVCLDDYRGVIIHPAVCYFPDNLFSLDTLISPDFKTYRGIKILAKQDEHNQSYAFARFITEKRFDVLVTCVPSDQLGKVYPEPSLDGVEIVHQLTGYVSQSIRAMASRPHDARDIDIGYRGSTQPLTCGRLGFEKKHIGDAVKGPAAAAGLITDISSRWEDRIHGADWDTFLARCKSVLGVESGSNLFDFDGEVGALCDEFTARHTELTPDTAAFYEAAHKSFLHRYEDNVDYGQLSPRHLEAAATGTLQILYEGRYSDILVPGRHYFPLKRDLSNLAEAFELIGNSMHWEAVTQAARRDLIDSDRLTYADFAGRFDAAVETVLQKKSDRANTNTRSEFSGRHQPNHQGTRHREGPGPVDSARPSAQNWLRRLVRKLIGN